MTVTSRPPRRGRNGHTADCPYQQRNPRGCKICAGERKGRPESAAVTEPGAQTSVIGAGPPLTSCPTCFAPTVAGDGHVCRWTAT